MNFGCQLARLTPLNRLIDARQIDLEDRPVSELAVDPDVTATLLYDPVDGGKSEPSAFADFLRRKKRLKNVRFCLLVHSSPSIGHDEKHVSTCDERRMVGGILVVQVGVTSFDHQFSTPRHCIACVHGQIHDDLLDLSRISFHGAQCGIQSSSELNIFADETSKHLLGFNYYSVEVQDPRCENLLAAECKEL